MHFGKSGLGSNQGGLCCYSPSIAINVYVAAQTWIGMHSNLVCSLVVVVAASMQRLLLASRSRAGSSWLTLRDQKLCKLHSGRNISLEGDT